MLGIKTTYVSIVLIALFAVTGCNWVSDGSERLENIYGEPDGDMDAVGPGEGVEGRAEHAVRQGHILELYEFLELVDLAAEENRPEENRGQQRPAHALDVTLLDRRDREGHHQRRHQQDESRERGQLETEDLLG